MRILVSLDTLDPPAGRIQVLGDRPRPAGQGEYHQVEFVGWLGMLHTLNAAIDAAPPGSSRTP
ncbi:MAG: hypothetical protein WB797_01545 [Nocardioides sp.]